MTDAHKNVSMPVTSLQSLSCVRYCNHNCQRNCTEQRRLVISFPGQQLQSLWNEMNHSVQCNFWTSYPSIRSYLHA